VGGKRGRGRAAREEGTGGIRGAEGVKFRVDKRQGVRGGRHKGNRGGNLIILWGTSPFRTQVEVRRGTETIVFSTHGGAEAFRKCLTKKGFGIVPTYGVATTRRDKLRRV